MDQDLLKYLDQRFSSIDQRFESMDQRFESMDQRFESMDQRFESMDQRFQETGQQIQALRNETAQRFSSIDQRFQETGQQIQALRNETAQRFDQADQRFDKLETEIREAHVAIEDLRNDVRLVAADGIVNVTEQLNRHKDEVSRKFGEIEALNHLVYDELRKSNKKLAARVSRRAAG